ncbi:MAG TPA: DinB family protein [Dehalococcoidia bacterium]|nr:DinB family protein [Dehalococcoidia bacterium]
MLTDVETFLRYFRAVNRRAMRDVGTLPAAAASWRPPAGEGENAWDIRQLVAHMCGSRLYFAHAYLNEGWTAVRWPEDLHGQASWVPALEHSCEQFCERLSGTPNEWLERRIELIDTPSATIAGWRALLMMVEHDIHHRSQIDTYAGLNGWPVAQIFDRTYEAVAAQRDDQLRKHGRA